MTDRADHTERIQPALEFLSFFLNNSLHLFNLLHAEPYALVHAGLKIIQIIEINSGYVRHLGFDITGQCDRSEEKRSPITLSHYALHQILCDERAWRCR